MCNMLPTTDLCNGQRHFWRRVHLCDAASDCRQVLVAEPLTQMHICCSLPMITRVQCGRLLKLDVEALHELHYQMITLGKVSTFCKDAICMTDWWHQQCCAILDRSSDQPLLLGRCSAARRCPPVAPAHWCPCASMRSRAAAAWRKQTPHPQPPLLHQLRHSRRQLRRRPPPAPLLLLQVLQSRQQRAGRGRARRQPLTPRPGWRLQSCRAAPVRGSSGSTAQHSPSRTSRIALRPTAHQRVQRPLHRPLRARPPVPRPRTEYWNSSRCSRRSRNSRSQLHAQWRC